MNKRKTYEYKNDFLYFVLRPDESRGKGILVYCSGVNISRFLSITREHRMAANPAFRGLQTLNLEIRALILSKGATPQTIKGNDCAGISTTKDRWNTELILIENASELCLCNTFRDLKLEFNNEFEAIITHFLFC